MKTRHISISDIPEQPEPKRVGMRRKKNETDLAFYIRALKYYAAHMDSRYKRPVDERCHTKLCISEAQHGSHSRSAWYPAPDAADAVWFYWGTFMGFHYHDAVSTPYITWFEQIPIKELEDARDFYERDVERYHEIQKIEAKIKPLQDEYEKLIEWRHIEMVEDSELFLELEALESDILTIRHKSDVDYDKNVHDDVLPLVWDELCRECDTSKRGCKPCYEFEYDPRHALKLIQDELKKPATKRKLPKKQVAVPAPAPEPKKPSYIEKDKRPLHNKLVWESKGRFASNVFRNIAEELGNRMEARITVAPCSGKGYGIGTHVKRSCIFVEIEPAYPKETKKILAEAKAIVDEFTPVTKPKPATKKEPVKKPKPAPKKTTVKASKLKLSDAQLNKLIDEGFIIVKINGKRCRITSKQINTKGEVT